LSHRITTGKQQGQKVFTLQTIAPIAPIAEQELAAGCAVAYCEESLALGYQKKGWR
jgi:hypothetical protein